MKNITSNSKELVISKSILIKNQISGKATGVLQINLDENKLFDLSKNVAESSKEIVTTVENIVQGPNKQSEGAQKSVEIYEKFENELMNTIKALNKVGDTTYTAVNILEESTSIISNLNTSTHNNSITMYKVAKTVLELSDNTEEVMSILENINKITKEIHLLALNASIEAARAGEHGKGFSVVASEIRKLALQSEAASMNIKNILNDISSAIQHSIEISTEDQECFKIEFREVNNAIRYFKDIKEFVSNINDLVKTSKSSIETMNEQ